MPTAAAPWTCYVERWRMAASRFGNAPVPPLPPGVVLRPWDPGLRDAHAAATHAAFADSDDCGIFPCFRTAAGCASLLQELSRDPTFFAAGTWLAEAAGVPVATVQAARTADEGLLHNLGVVPAFRGGGIARALAAAALAEFRAAGLRRVVLEVSARNLGALALYRSFGFRRFEVLYRVEQPA